MRTNFICITETQKLIQDFEIKTDDQISARRPDLRIISNKKEEFLQNCKLCSHGRPQGIEKAVEHESDDDTYCNWCSSYSHQMISKRTGELGNNWTGGDRQNYCITEVSQNIEKSPGDLRRLFVTQILVGNH